MIDLNEVYVFVKVVEAGSFVGASKHLDMPSTTVSRKIQKLEEALGVRLIQRTTRKLSLTDVGRHYFENCQQSLVNLEEANTLVSQSRSLPKGILRIASPIGFACHYLQPWISDFLALYPELQVELEATDRYVNIIEERIDIAFRSGELKDSSLIARNIGPKQSIFCASPEYLKKAGVPTTPHELIEHDCVLMGASIKSQNWRFVTAEGELSVPVSGRYAVDNMELIIQAVHHGMGVAQVPYTLVVDSLNNGKLKRVLEKYPAPSQNMHVVYPSYKHLAINVRMFIDHVVKLTQPYAPWDARL